EIIGVRLEELFEMVLDELYRMDIRDLPGGIVLTGGTAKLEGLPQLAREVLQTRVRTYVPEFIGVREPKFSSSVGLIRYARLEDEFFGHRGDSPFGEEMETAAPAPAKKKKEP